MSDEEPARLDHAEWREGQPRPSRLRLTDIECVRILGMSLHIRRYLGVC
jgi:hypothetical protein